MNAITARAWTGARWRAERKECSEVAGAVGGGVRSKTATQKSSDCFAKAKRQPARRPHEPQGQLYLEKKKMEDE